MSATSPQRPRRTKRVRYTYESDSDLESRPASRAVPIRTSRRIQSYRETSDDELNESNNDPSTSESDTPASQPAEKGTTRTVRKKRSHVKNRRTKVRRSARHSQSFELFKPRKPNIPQEQPTQKIVVEIPISGKVPPWQSLPFELLRTIFKYAAYPLYVQNSRATSSINWLCGVSLLCRSFHDASIAALLHDPPIFPAHRANGLIELLQQDQKKTIIDYRSKIKSLQVEAKQLLVKKSGIELEHLLDYTPLLERLRIYSNYDDFDTVHWAHPSQAKGKKWSYPDSLFEKLDQQNLQLKSFEWNGRFPNSVNILPSILRHHSRPCLSQLLDLSFLNIDIEDKNIELATQNLSHVLAGLPHLKHLSFRKCNILNTTIVSHFPVALESLSITNCQSLTSDIVSAYLVSNGSHLTSLTLSGNQCMSLSFLAGLANCCPRLQHLDLNLTYLDPSSYKDTEPLFEDALPDGPPSWPSSLITINIENLRQINAAEAEDFFQSLVTSASSLPYLKVLNIKAIVKGEWRDRAKLRQEWIPRLQDVFLDRSEPMTHTTRKREMKPLPPRKEGDRQSSRIQHLKQLSISQSDSNDSDSAISSQPVRGPVKRSSRAVAESEDANQFIQGRCNIVNVVLSDQRPAQDQWREADFLDDEPSDDGEWNGRDMVFN